MEPQEQQVPQHMEQQQEELQVQLEVEQELLELAQAIKVLHPINQGHQVLEAEVDQPIPSKLRNLESE